MVFRLGPHTVDSLLTSEGLPLLCPIPFDDESVSEGQRGTRVCGADVYQHITENKVRK